MERGSGLIRPSSPLLHDMGKGVGDGDYSHGLPELRIKRREAGFG
jgi:hypothetical protein